MFGDFTVMCLISEFHYYHYFVFQPFINTLSLLFWFLQSLVNSIVIMCWFRVNKLLLQMLNTYHPAWCTSNSSHHCTDCICIFFGIVEWYTINSGRLTVTVPCLRGDKPRPRNHVKQCRICILSGSCILYTIEM